MADDELTTLNGRRPITLSLRKELIEQYQRYCDRMGAVFSRRVEMLIEKELKEAKDRGEDVS